MPILARPRTDSHRALDISSRKGKIEAAMLLETIGNASVMGWSTIAESRRVMIMGISTESDRTSKDTCRSRILIAITPKCGSIKAKDIWTPGWQTEAAYEIVMTISLQSLRRKEKHLKLTSPRVVNDAGFQFCTISCTNYVCTFSLGN